MQELRKSLLSLPRALIISNRQYPAQKLGLVCGLRDGIPPALKHRYYPESACMIEVTQMETIRQTSSKPYYILLYVRIAIQY